MSSWLCDSAELVSGAWLTSAYAGHGVLAEDIPDDGEHGASVLFDQIALPGDAGKEVRGLILTQPTGLTLWEHGEDGAVTAEGSDGAYVYTIQVYVDGVALGSPKTVTLTFGAASVSVGLASNSGALSVSAGSSSSAAAAITGGSGALSVSAGASSSASTALAGGSGSLSVSAAGVAVASAALAGGSGALSVAASGPAVVSAAITGSSGALSIIVSGATPTYSERWAYRVPAFGKTYTAN